MTEERHPSLAFTAVRSLAYAAVFVMLWIWIVAVTLPLDDRFGLYLPETLRLPGAILAAGGGLLAVACATSFTVAGRGTPAPFDAPRHFVASGPYRYVRNPMYLGGLGVLIGSAFVLQSPATLGVAFLFLLLAHSFVLIYEEPTLERRFGDEYRVYRASVHRWLPGRPGS